MTAKALFKANLFDHNARVSARRRRQAFFQEKKSRIEMRLFCRWKNGRRFTASVPA
ncbi:MAG: hypothetical protein LH479_05935 [Polaromonas sp.]|nr:hypothetical protein [Polaromonas sp.]